MPVVGTTGSTIDVCGKQTLDYVLQCLSTMGRLGPSEPFTIRALASSISKGVGVARILTSEFGAQIIRTDLDAVEVLGAKSSCLQIHLMNGPKVPERNPEASVDIGSYPTY